MLLLFAVCLRHVVCGQLTYETVWVQYDSVWTYKNLQLIPIRFKSPGGSPVVQDGTGRLISLPEAIEKGKVKIREVQDKRGASVNTLEIINNSKDNILLNSGELLSGGKQDRMIGETTVIPPGKGINYVDVFCVEKGRWDDKAKTFKHKGTADISLKKVMDINGRQSEIWKEIQRQYAGKQKSSEAWPYLELYAGKSIADSSYLRFFNNKYKQSDSLFAGFIAITKNRIISCELFANTEITNMSYPSILAGFINEAVVRGNIPAMEQRQIIQFMDQLLSDEKTQRLFVASHGKMHRIKNRVFHIVVYGD